VSQFLASAASEKLAVMMTMDYLRREAALRAARRFRALPERHTRPTGIRRRPGSTRIFDNVRHASPVGQNRSDASQSGRQDAQAGVEKRDRVGQAAQVIMNSKGETASDFEF
jgi:hypothetical protein